MPQYSEASGASMVEKLKPTRLTAESALAGETPDITRYWSPPGMEPLGGTASYEAFTEAQRLRYNQYYGMLLAEQFIWTEHAMLVKPASRLLAGHIESDNIRALLQSFVADEIAHNEAFWTLLQKAAPHLYPTRRFTFFFPPARVRNLIGVLTRFPRRFPALILFVTGLEEHTIQISRRYKEAEVACDGPFSRTFTLHAVDEARHCMIDTLFADWLFDSLPPRWYRLNSYLLKRLFKVYYDLSWGHQPILDRLVQDFPELRPRYATLLKETLAARGAGFVDHLFDPRNAPLTAKKAEVYPMLRKAIAALVGT